MKLSSLLKALKTTQKEDRIAEINRKIEENRQARLRLKESSIALQKEREELEAK